MNLNCVLGDSKLRCRLFVQQAPNQQGQQLLLARRKRTVARKEIRLFKGFPPGNSVLLQGLFDGGQKDSFVNRLSKEVDGAALHCFDGGRDITASGDEDDGNRYLRRR